MSVDVKDGHIYPASVGTWQTYLFESSSGTFSRGFEFYNSDNPSLWSMDSRDMFKLQAVVTSSPDSECLKMEIVTSSTKAFGRTFPVQPETLLRNAVIAKRAVCTIISSANSYQYIWKQDAGTSWNISLGLTHLSMTTIFMEVSVDPNSKEFHSDKDCVHGSQADWLFFSHIWCVFARGSMAKVFATFYGHGYIAHRQQWHTTLANHNLRSSQPPTTPTHVNRV